MAGDKEIYILLTGTGSWLSRVIQWYTRAPLNHASIAFDEELTEVYSFGRKYENNPLVGGLVQEDIHTPFFRGAECAVYSCRVDRRQYRLMRSCVEEMLKEQDRYKYHILGLVGLVLNRKLERKDAFFCSQFVSSVFEQAGITLLDKPPHLTTPGDLAGSPLLREIYKGPVTGYLTGTPEILQLPYAAS
jgi:hypothetical protein